MAAKGSMAERIRGWCAYQERSQHETRRKLAALGVHGSDAEQLIAQLIAENYLNEERFAVAFAGGKFRVKQWGKIKIVQELRRHRISERCIQQALEAISDEDYSRALQLIARKKIAVVLTPDRRKKFYTVSRSLISKGFEPDLVNQTLREIFGEVSEYEFRT